jgi:ATP-dependent helicase HepA
LDPENYTNVTAEAFKERTKRRTELGRAFLALRNASITPLVKLNAKKLAEIMPDDDVLQKFLREITSDGADVKRIQQEIHFHISETYRIHRRMLRTRRRWITELDAHYLRSVKENADTELDESPYIACWQILEDWRTETAARVGNDDAIASICAKQYTALAQAISADPESLPQIVEETLNSTAAAPTETELLEKLVDPRQADAMIKARASLIRDILKERLARDGNGSKCVVFCASTEICQLVVKLCSQTFPKSWVCIADKSTDKNKASATFSDFAINDARVLVTDSVGEEGFNLQYSKAVIFQDLPWSPMRIEQRIGRFDRIEKQGRIICHTITSGEDESLCLDEIWRRVLTEGFGIFTQSISDLQNIVEAIIPHLQQVAFFGGPNSLLAEIPNLKTRISSERDAIEEQDVIDGMHTLSPNSPLCKDVKLADAEAEHFGTALIDYVHNNIGLIPQWNEENNSLSFELQRSASPIIPADRFDALSRMLHKPSTFYREVAIESLGLQFLRPGHIAVDACLNLLAWDDRGRSFAMWRHVPTIEHPRVVFRCIVLAHAEVEPIRQKLASTIATPQGSGALIRMASGWFPDNVSELFFDEQGQPVLDSISAICKSPYNKDTDLNLGKDRAAFVREQFGIHTWRTWCEAVPSSAINNVASSQELHKKRDSAIAQASEHFALMRARLNSRQRAGIESQDQVEQSRIALKEVEEAIRTALANPKLRLDSIGAYILSAKPFWEQSL